MNFTSKIKNEIINLKMNKNESWYFLQGIFFSNFNNENENIKIKFVNENIKSFAIMLLKTNNIDFKIENDFICVKIKINKKIETKYANFVFSGIFLSSGSISNLNSSSYHLEINFKNETMCNLIMNFAKKHILFNKIKNKNNYVLYLKKNETISDFLHIIGAQKSYFEFIDSIIERDLKNQVTRIFNLDVHNQEKMVDSHKNFLENLEYIKNKNLEHNFSKEQLIFYEFKKQNEFKPLSEIAKELERLKNIKKTKSGLNHWLIKLRNICDEN